MTLLRKHWKLATFFFTMLLFSGAVLLLQIPNNNNRKVVHYSVKPYAHRQEHKELHSNQHTVHCWLDGVALLPRSKVGVGFSFKEAAVSDKDYPILFTLTCDTLFAKPIIKTLSRNEFVKDAQYDGNIYIELYDRPDLQNEHPLYGRHTITVRIDCSSFHVETLFDIFVQANGE